MNLLSLVLIGTIGSSTLMLGSYVKAQAQDVVVKTDMVTLSKALTSFEIFNNKYPENFEELSNKEGVSAIGANYIYKRSSDGLEAMVLGVSDSKLYCWNSKGMIVVEVTSEYECSMGHPGSDFSRLLP